MGNIGYMVEKTFIDCCTGLVNVFIRYRISKIFFLEYINKGGYNE